MTTRLRARFDGRVLVPEGPVDLPQGPLLEVQLQPVEQPTATTGELTGLAKLARDLQELPTDPDAPTDMAAQHDYYLYGTPKRDEP